MKESFPVIPRKEYTRPPLRRADLAPDPLDQFVAWLQEVVEAGVGHGNDEPNAMTLATADKNGIPSARVVSLKTVDERGFIFCSRHDGLKGQDLRDNPHAALVVYWPMTERQVRVSGAISRLSSEESARYFQARPVDAQRELWLFAQSEVIPDRQTLDERFVVLAQTYAGQSVPQPPHWGGFVLVPTSIEFWQGGAHRLHDRIRYRRDGSTWIIERLAP